MLTAESDKSQTVHDKSVLQSTQVGPELTKALKAWESMLFNAEQSYMSTSKCTFLCILFKEATVNTSELKNK